MGPNTPGSPPFPNAPPPTPYVNTYNEDEYTDADTEAETETNVDSLSTSNSWSWKAWLGAAFVVVLGVVLLGAKEDDTSSRRGDDSFRDLCLDQAGCGRG